MRTDFAFARSLAGFLQLIQADSEEYDFLDPLDASNVISLWHSLGNSSRTNFTSIHHRHVLLVVSKYVPSIGKHRCSLDCHINLAVQIVPSLAAISIPDHELPRL